MATEIRYTIDGHTPSTSSQLYSAPLVYNRSMKVKSRRFDTATGEASPVKEDYIKVLPSDYTTKKIYMCHLMVTIGKFSADYVGWFNDIKNQGYTTIWLHCENYNGDLQKQEAGLPNGAIYDLVAAVEQVPGLTWIAGFSGGGDAYQTSLLFDLMISSPSTLTINGKMVMTGWGLQNGQNAEVVNAIQSKGYSLDDFYWFPHTLFPYSYGGLSSTWVGEGFHGNDGDYATWAISGNPESFLAIDRMFETRPFHGSIGFGGDNASTEGVIEENELRRTASLTIGKYAIGCHLHFYCSYAYSDYNFEGSAKIWEAVLAPAPHERLQGMSDTTANDTVECTYLARGWNTEEDGLWYPVPIEWGYTLGGHMRMPLPSHVGMQKFARPFVDAYLNNQQSPVFDTDRIFYRHMLHPSVVAQRTTIPKNLMDVNWYKGTDGQEHWTGTIYYNIDNSVPCRNAQLHLTDEIVMAAHLSAPAYLKINDTTFSLDTDGTTILNNGSGSMFPKGYAIVHLPFTTFRGNPRYAIIRGGVEVKYGFSAQPIDDDIYPGCYGLISTEVNELNLPTPNAPTVALNSGAFVATPPSGYSESDLEYIEDHYKWTNYTGPIPVSGSLRAQYYRFRVKAGSERNASPVAFSPIVP